jgi:hypothetical protein
VKRHLKLAAVVTPLLSAGLWMLGSAPAHAAVTCVPSTNLCVVHQHSGPYESDLFVSADNLPGVVGLHCSGGPGGTHTWLETGGGGTVIAQTPTCPPFD